MVNVDPYVLGGIVVAIIGGVGTAIAFWVRLEMKVKHLEKQIDENPMFAALKQIERDAAIKIFSDYLKNTPLERGNG